MYGCSHPDSKLTPSQNSKYHNTIWCDEECKAAIRNRDKALKRVQKHPTQHNIENHRVIWAQTRRVIKTSKRRSWQTYVSKINSRTSVKKVWSMVHKIAWKSPATNIKHLNANNTEITEIPHMANSLNHTFSNNSSLTNCSNKFQAFRNQVENQHLQFKSNNSERYTIARSLLMNSGMPS